MLKISTFTYKGEDFDVMYNNWSLSYTFDVKGKRYGNAVKLEDKSIQGIMNGTMCLLLNLLDTKEKLCTAKTSKKN